MQFRGGPLQLLDGRARAKKGSREKKFGTRSRYGEFFTGKTVRHELSAESSLRGSKSRAVKQRILADEFFSEIPFPRPLSLRGALPRDP